MDRYAVSLYWAFTTMTTVGFGDIVGTNLTEYLVVMLGMVVGASVFGYVIGNVTTIVESFDPAAAQYQEKMDNVKSFMKVSAGGPSPTHWSQRLCRIGEGQGQPPLPPPMPSWPLL